MRTAIVMCSVRVGLVAALVFGIWGFAHYTGFSYDDLKVLLAFVNAYAPEGIAIVIFGALGYAFYRANDRPDFSFMNFFKSGPHIYEDVGKLVFFLLAVAVFWSYFALFWREKLTTEYVVGTAGLFILQGIAAISGKAFGKQQPKPPPETEEK